MTIAITTPPKEMRKKKPKNKIDKPDKKALSLIERRIQENQKNWIESYEKYWTVTAACKETGISRETYYQWIRAYPDFVKRIKICKREQIEYAESKVYQAIQTNSLVAAIYFLKTHSKAWQPAFKSHVEGEIKTKFQLTDEQYTELAKRIARQVGNAGSSQA